MLLMSVDFLLVDFFSRHAAEPHME
jgi:hypothetical protein